MALFALSTLPPSPWRFVLIVSAVFALTPPLIKYYLRIRRIPLWHLYVAAPIVVFTTSLAADYVREIHDIENLYYLYDNGMFFGGTKTLDPADIAPFRPTPVLHILLELCLIALVPGLLAMAISWGLMRLFRLGKEQTRLEARDPQHRVAGAP